MLWGLLFKLILFPAFIFVLYFMILNQRGETVQIAFLEAAMAPMITAAIIGKAAQARFEYGMPGMMPGIRDMGAGGMSE